MLDENHSPDSWVLSYPVPDGPGRAQLKWTWQCNVTGILSEWQSVDVAGHNGLHRCRLCPLRESNEQPRSHGLARVEQRAVWSYELMSWDVCGQPAVFGARCLSFWETKNIDGHVFLFPISRCPSPRIVERICRFIWCIIWSMWSRHEIKSHLVL